MAQVERQSSLLGFLLRLAFILITVQFVRGFVRLLGAGRQTPRVSATRPKTLVDRASAIDVPFTEEG
jgi:hypothetical protein